MQPESARHLLQLKADPNLVASRHQARLGFGSALHQAAWSDQVKLSFVTVGFIHS